MEDLEQPKAKRKQPLNRKHKCPKCGAKLASQQSLQAHMRFVHTDKRFVCDICDGKFKKKFASAISKFKKKRFYNNSTPTLSDPP